MNYERTVGTRASSVQWVAMTKCGFIVDDMATLVRALEIADADQIWVHEF